MTAILAIRRKGETVIASDSSIFRYNRKDDNGPKWFRGSNFWVMKSDSARATQLIEVHLQKFDAPIRWTYEDAIRFGQWVMELMVKHGGKKEAEVGDLPFHPLELILATACGLLYQVSPSGYVQKIPKFVAAAAGNQYCTGVLDALYDLPGLGTEEIARRAINTALRYSPHVGGRAHVMTVFRRKGHRKVRTSDRRRAK